MLCQLTYKTGGGGEEHQLPPLNKPLNVIWDRDVAHLVSVRSCAAAHTALTP